MSEGVPAPGYLQKSAERYDPKRVVEYSCHAKSATPLASIARGKSAEEAEDEEVTEQRKSPRAQRLCGDKDS